MRFFFFSNGIKENRLIFDNPETARPEPEQNVEGTKAESNEKNDVPHDLNETAEGGNARVERAENAGQVARQQIDTITNEGVALAPEGQRPAASKELDIGAASPTALEEVPAENKPKTEKPAETKPEGNDGTKTDQPVEKPEDQKTPETKEAPKTKGQKIIQEMQEQIDILKDKKATRAKQLEAAVTIFAKLSELMGSIKDGTFSKEPGAVANAPTQTPTASPAATPAENKGAAQTAEAAREQVAEVPNSRRERLSKELKEKGSVDELVKEKNASIEPDKTRINGEINAVESEEKDLEKKIGEGNQKVRDKEQQMATADEKTKDNIGYELRMAKAEVEADQKQLDIAKARRAELINELSAIENNVKQDTEELNKMKSEWNEKVNMTKQSIEIAKQIDIPELKSILEQMTTEPNERELSVGINLGADGVAKLTEVATANGVDISILKVGPDNSLVKNPEDLMKVMQQITEKLKTKKDEEAKKETSQATPQEAPAQTETPDFLEGMNKIAGVTDQPINAASNPESAAPQAESPMIKKVVPPEQAQVIAPGADVAAAPVEAAPQTPTGETDAARQKVESLRAQLPNAEDKVQVTRELKDAIAAYERAYGSEIVNNPTPERQKQIVDYLTQVSDLKKTLG